MPRLLSIATGNFLTAGSWGLSDPTALLDSEAANTALTTSYVTSSTFTPGAITISGIAIKLASRAASPTGTISVALDLVTATVPGTEVTLNVSDLPTCGATQKEGGWILFKFASPVLVLAATIYGVKAKTSSTTQANLYSSATTNWSRQLLTTTTQAPAAGDVLDVIGEHTGAGTGNSFTITMDNTAATDFGAGTDGVVALTVNKRGTLIWGSAASTAYYLRLSGDLIVYNGGSYYQGETGTTMPASSSAKLDFDPVADGGMGFYCRNGSTVVGQGASKTTVCKLSADEAAAQTVLSVDANTGWASPDEVVVCATGRTATQSEKLTISSSGATTITLTSGLANAHSGTSAPLDSRAEIGNLTRNVKIGSISSTIMSYFRVAPTAVVDLDYVELYYLGENVAGKRSVEIETLSTGNSNINQCSIHDCEDGGIYLIASCNNFSITNNILWNCGNTLLESFFLTATTGTNWTLSGNLIISPQTTRSAIALSAMGGTVTNNTTVGGASGWLWAETGMIGTFDGNAAHSAGTHGMAGQGLLTQGTLTNCKVWRNTSAGISVSAAHFVVDGLVAFGNAINIQSADGSVPSSLILKNSTINGDSSFATTRGMSIAGAITVWIFDSSFGETVVHTTADLNVGSSSARIYDFNTTLASATEYENPAAMSPMGGYFSHKHDGSASTFANRFRYGTVASETTTRHTASGYSWKLTPNNASFPLRFPGPYLFDTFHAQVEANVQVTVKAWVRKDSSYNGVAPRLILVGGMISGITSDVVASLTVGVDTWEQLSVSGTPTEKASIDFYLDCDGTAGNVFVDDITITQAGLAADTGTLDYPYRGGPSPGIYVMGSSGGGAMKLVGAGGGLVA